jgi:hypothetical protein
LDKTTIHNNRNGNHSKPQNIIVKQQQMQKYASAEDLAKRKTQIIKAKYIQLHVYIVQAHSTKIAVPKV